MKWTLEQTAKLRELCNKGVPNADIAKAIGCKTTDVHAKRSQLGITIPKIKAAQQKSAPRKNKKPLPVMERPLNRVEKAFRDLHDALLVAVGSDWTTDQESYVLSDTAALILSVEALYVKAIQST